MATGAPTYKIILCGEYGVGKSSIFRRFMTNTFTSENIRKSTVGLDHSSKIFTINNTDVKLILWDTGGMERMSFIGSSYYRGANAALLCYSVNNRETFTILAQYILDIVMNAEGAKIFLCGNMSDCEMDQDVVSDADIENFTVECDNVLSGTYKISCKDSRGFWEMFKDMARIMHEEAEKKLTLRRGMVLKPPPTDFEAKKKKCCNSS